MSMASEPPRPASPLPSAKVMRKRAVDIDAEAARHALVSRPRRAPARRSGCIPARSPAAAVTTSAKHDQEQAVDAERQAADMDRAAQVIRQLTPAAGSCPRRRPRSRPTRTRARSWSRHWSRSLSGRGGGTCTRSNTTLIAAATMKADGQGGAETASPSGSSA